MAAWPYNTAQWRKLRLLKLSEQPLCQFHLKRGEYVAATVVDHDKAISQGGEAFPPLDQLSSLCASCHTSKTNARDNPFAFGGGGVMRATGLDGLPIDPYHTFTGQSPDPIAWRPSGLWPSLVPLTIVCGPPASGKTTYVTDHAAIGDTIIDLDQIAAAIDGEGMHSWHKRHTRQAVDTRNAMLRSLGRDKDRRGAAWLILTAGDPASRQWWAERLRPVRVIVLETPAAVCTERVKADPDRKLDQRSALRGIDRWWNVYRRLTGELQL